MYATLQASIYLLENKLYHSSLLFDYRNEIHLLRFLQYFNICKRKPKYIQALYNCYERTECNLLYNINIYCIIFGTVESVAYLSHSKIFAVSQFSILYQKTYKTMAVKYTWKGCTKMLTVVNINFIVYPYTLFVYN